MELKTLSNCIISGIETACFKLCKTCSETSHCGNPNACTSCYPGDNKVSENIDDKFFQCSKECDVIQIRLDDGSYFCPSPTESSTLKFLTETTEANSLVSKSSKHVESNTTWTIFIAIVFLGVIIIIALWISRKNALKKTISNNHFQEICVTNKKSFISPSSNISKSLIKPSFTKQVAPEKTKTSLEVIMNNKDFEKGKKLRGGNYSTVFEGTLRGEIVAIKVARKEGKKNIYKELQVYEKVEHPSIIKALGVHFSVENMLFLKKRNFNLSDYFIDYGNELNFLRLKQYCIQVADGMRYLHEKQILHGDLKIDNILVKDEDGSSYAQINRSHLTLNFDL